tara:strand:+ start:769 stop:942 length:174 start_codon:yes stop_codon:yes gene_type:complete
MREWQADFECPDCGKKWTQVYGAKPPHGFHDYCTDKECRMQRGKQGDLKSDKWKKVQ